MGNRRTAKPSLRVVPRTAAGKVAHIDHATRAMLRSAFLQLAELAETGEITGMVYSVTDRRGAMRHGLLGTMRTTPALAHHAAAQLADMLLYPEELDLANGGAQ